MIEKEFKNTVEEIKQQINSTQLEIFRNANMNLVKQSMKILVGETNLLMN